MCGEDGESPSEGIVKLGNIEIGLRYDMSSVHLHISANTSKYLTTIRHRHARYSAELRAYLKANHKIGTCQYIVRLAVQERRFMCLDDVH